jgi:hypothetical protein
VQAVTKTEPQVTDDTGPKTVTTQKGPQTKIETTGAAKTTTTTTPIAKAFLVRAGPYHGRAISTEVKKCMVAAYKDFDGAQEGATYSFVPSDIAEFAYSRVGWTYGALVVPYKLVIVDRSFTSSASVLPYVGWENWVPGLSGATIVAAGIGTAPPSTQTGTSAAQASSGSSSTTKATLSLAFGQIYSLGSGTFKIGVLVGVDTQGSHTGFKNQGKPWVALSLGAGI